MSSLARLTGLKNSGSSFASVSANHYKPAYAATINLNPPYQSYYHLVQPAALTGAVTFTAPVGNVGQADDVAPFVGDKIVFLLNAATTQVATFGTGFAPTGTLSVTGTKYAYIEFIF